MKTHFSIDPANSIAVACGRSVNEYGQTPFTARVTCGTCRSRKSFIEQAKADVERAEAEFQAQEPHTVVPQFGRVNDDGVMECSMCAGVLWRERPRSLWSYHFVCANDECGKSVHPLTESGMCN